VAPRNKDASSTVPDSVTIASRTALTVTVMETLEDVTAMAALQVTTLTTPTTAVDPVIPAVIHVTAHSQQIVLAVKMANVSTVVAVKCATML